MNAKSMLSYRFTEKIIPLPSPATPVWPLLLHCGPALNQLGHHVSEQEIPVFGKSVFLVLFYYLPYLAADRF